MSEHPSPGGSTAVLEAAGKEPAAPRPAAPRRGGARGGWGAAGLFVAVEAALLAVLHAWQPRFFYLDDKVMQYVPVWYWLGQRTGWSGPPLVDPDQGAGGGFTADLQYGVLDPFHWALAWAIGHTGGLNASAWGLHVLAVGVLGLGTVVLARRLGASVGWSVAAALGAANCGFLFWFGASWWPAAWSTALLPWLWWSLIGRSRWAVPTALLAGYLLGSSGYPYVAPFAGLVVVSVLLETGLARRSWRLWQDRALVARVAALVGGVLASASGLLAASAMSPYSARAAMVGDPHGNPGLYIPSLFDLLVGGPTTSSQMSGWWGNILPSAAMATGWFVLPALALVRWRGVRARGGLRIPGVLTALVLVVASAVASQTPTSIGSFRNPIRYVVYLQVAAPVAVVVLLGAAGVVLTRRRVLLAVGAIVLQGLLAVARVPSLVGWHVLAVVLGTVTVAGAAWACRGRRRLAVALVVAMTTVAPLLGVAAATGYRTIETDAAGKPSTGTAEHGPWDGLTFPPDVAGMRAHALEPGLDATVVYWGSTTPDDRGLAEGVPIGSAALVSGMRPGFGYSSVGQGGWTARWCQDFLGQSAVSCADPVGSLLADVPGTDRTWLELMSKDVLLVDGRAPAQLTAALGDRWRLVGPQGGFLRYERLAPTQGRVTGTGPGVTGVRALQVGTDSETYDVTWSAGGNARVLTRIPYWPGYRASIDGRPLDVQDVDATLLAVDLPRTGGSGQLRIWFVPPHHRLALACVGIGALIGLGAVAAELLRRRRPAGGGRPVHPG